MGDEAGEHLILVGLMGAGKSSVGRICAERLARPFVDTDEIVEATAGRSVAQIFAADGEEAFRDLERRAVVDACAAPRASVIACGGGAVLDPANRDSLHRAGWVVWLEADAEVLAARIGSDAGRPLLGGRDPGKTLARLADLRAPAYEGVADARVSTGGRSVAEVAAAVVDVFSARSEGAA